jgi:hypothetical protein
MSNNELDLISSNLDQPIPLKERQSLFDRIDNILDEAITTGNGWKAINACSQLNEIARLSSISLAKFMYGIVINWDKFHIDEDMYMVLTEAFGCVKSTITRYTDAWEKIISGEIPAEHADKMIDRGIRDLDTVSKMLDSGYVPDESQWERIVNAPDRMELEKEIREVTHEPVSEKTIFIQMEMSGEVNVYHLGEKHSVGKLDTASGIYAVQKAIYRMCRGGGVLRK